MEKTKTIYLEAPIEFAGGKYDKLALREFTVGEWQKSETHKEGTPQFAQLLSFVTGWPVPAVHLLPISVFNEAVAFLMGFMAAGPQTGEI